LVGLMSESVQRADNDLRCQLPEDWKPGLMMQFATLSRKSVRRANDDPAAVMLACLQHNLRSGNQRHRHRSHIDSARTPLNDVLRGAKHASAVDQAGRQLLAEHGANPTRKDAIMGIEIVFQAPTSWDVPQFYAECIRWAEEWFQADAGSVLSAVVHRDQRRPHMHVLMLPLLDGRLQGHAMTSGAKGRGAQAAFRKHMRERLGLRPDRERSFGDIMTGMGAGPRRREEAERRDRELMRRASMGLAVGGRSGQRPAASAGVMTAMPGTAMYCASSPLLSHELRTLWRQCEFSGSGNVGLALHAALRCPAPVEAV
jgi:Plasmid recombination enzyme